MEQDHFNDSTELDDNYRAAFLKPGILSSNIYQMEMLTSITWRLMCKKDPKINTWRLATEVFGARGFHDLVLEYDMTTDDKNNTDDKKLYRFMQIKYSKNLKIKLLDSNNLVSDEKLNREGSLFYLFKSYLNIRKKFNIKFNQIENLTVFTNLIQCDTELLVRLENDKLYSFEGKGSRYRFDIEKLRRNKPTIIKQIQTKMESHLKKPIKEDNDMVIDDNCIVDFLNKLVFMVGQPSEPELENMITEEMSSTLNAPQIFYNNLYKDIIKWSLLYEKIDGVGTAPYITHDQVKNNLQKTLDILLEAKKEKKFVKEEIFDGILECEIKSLSLSQGEQKD